MYIYSIFPSVDGEVNGFSQGALTTFIRFSGCNLHCKWCDTHYALKKESGKDLPLIEIMEKVESIGLKKVTITGGEPLLQLEGFLELTRALFQGDYAVTVETNGSFPCNGYGVQSWVVDYKLPSSGCEDKMTTHAFEKLREQDFVKFIIETEDDFEQAVMVQRAFQDRLKLLCKFAYSPCFGKLDPNTLIHWLLKEKAPNTILNLQLHKFCDLKEPN